jgi:hypothetical protein
MNAELTMTFPDGGQFARAKKLLSLHLGKINSVFRSNPSTRPPARPKVRHCLEKLTFYNGRIYGLRRERLSKVYMPLPDVEVAKKSSFTEIDGGRCEYHFELNTATDPIWRWFFQKHLPDFPVEFQSNTMVFACRPANLESSYERIKASIAQANVWYQDERAELIPKVIAKDDERLAAREMEANRQVGLRRQFDCLEV